MGNSLGGHYDAVNHYELACIGPDGIDVRCYGYPPRTDDFAELPALRGYTHVVQKIGNVYEVYDLSTLRRPAPWTDGPWTIGLPVATHENMDAAIMMATLLT